MIYYFLILCFTVYSVSGTEVMSCQDGLLPKVTINDCSGPTCLINHDSNISVTMNFNSPKYLENISTSIIAMSSLGYNITLDSKSNDACQGIWNTFCPLVENEFIQYRYDIKFDVIPWIPIQLYFSIVDNDVDEIAVCFTVNIFPFFDFGKHDYKGKMEFWNIV